MKSPLNLRCYVRDARILHQADTIDALFAALTRQGYYLVSEEEFEPSFRVWWSTMRTRPERLEDLPSERQRLLLHLRQSGLSSQFRRDLGLYLALQESHFACRAYHGEHLFAFDLDLAPRQRSGVPLVTVSVEPEYLTVGHGETAEKMHDLWLDVLKALYQHLRPLYGWVHDADFDRPGFGWALEIDPEHLEERTPLDSVLRADASVGHLRFLSLVNVLGPKLVERYGRARVLTTPAWHVEEMEDGGVLLLPEPFSWDYVPVWREAEQHLDLSPSESFTVAHLAAVLNQHSLLKHLTVTQLAKATASSCLFDVLSLLMPQRYVTVRRYHHYSEEDYTRLIRKLARVVGKQWQPEQVHTFFMPDQALIEFESNDESFYWRFKRSPGNAGLAPGFLEHLHHLAQSRLRGTFLPLRSKGSALAYFFLPTDAWQELESMLPRLRSGWPASRELSTLFPYFTLSERKQICAYAEATPQTATTTESKMPNGRNLPQSPIRLCQACSTCHLERCRMISEPLREL